MQQLTIIIITGMPATGKTTLGTLLSEKYQIPFISKDALKERMFDNLGWNDKEWSLKVSAASHRIMDYFVQEELKCRRSVIVESNFKRQIDSERFARLQQQYDCAVVQVLCWADGETVFRRFMERIDTTARHQGHVERISPEEIREEFIKANGKDQPLVINGETIELDTSDVSAIDYEKVYKVIEEL